MTTRNINLLVVHCSDSPDDRDIGAKEITEWHKARGWSTIGYHAVIRRDGTVELGRPEDVVGAHVEGHNANSLGVCVVGRKNFDHRQMLALMTLLKRWMNKYSIPVISVLGHYELNPGKTCPNMDMQALRKALAA